MSKLSLLTIGLLVLQLACSATKSSPVANNSVPKNENETNRKKENASAEPKYARTGNRDTNSLSRFVKFTNGEKTIKYEENLPKDSTYKFTLRAKEDQSMSVHTDTDNGKVSFTISQGGKVIPTAIDTDKWTGKLAVEGDYEINVTRKSGDGKFRIEIATE